MDVLMGAMLFELGFAPWVALLFILESIPGSLSGDGEGAGLVEWFFFGLWIVVLISAFLAALGVVIAEGIGRAVRGRKRGPVALTAGTLFGLGWALLFILAVALSKPFAGVEAIDALLFWSYLVVGPLSAFMIAARLFVRMAGHGRTAAA